MSSMPDIDSLPERGVKTSLKERHPRVIGPSYADSDSRPGASDPEPPQPRGDLPAGR